MIKFNLTQGILSTVYLLFSLSSLANAFDIYVCEGKTRKNYIEMTYSNYNTEPSARTMMFFRELILDGEHYAVGGNYAGTAYGFGSITNNQINMQLKFARKGTGEKILIGNLIGRREYGKEWQFTMIKTDNYGYKKTEPIVLNLCKKVII